MSVRIVTSCLRLISNLANTSFYISIGSYSRNNSGGNLMTVIKAISLRTALETDSQLLGRYNDISQRKVSYSGFCLHQLCLCSNVDQIQSAAAHPCRHGARALRPHSRHSAVQRPTRTLPDVVRGGAIQRQHPVSHQHGTGDII